MGHSLPTLPEGDARPLAAVRRTELAVADLEAPLETAAREAGQVESTLLALALIRP